MAAAVQIQPLVVSAADIEFSIPEGCRPVLNKRKVTVAHGQPNYDDTEGETYPIEWATPEAQPDDMEVHEQVGGAGWGVRAGGVVGVAGPDDGNDMVQAAPDDDATTLVCGVAGAVPAEAGVSPHVVDDSMSPRATPRRDCVLHLAGRMSMPALMIWQLDVQKPCLCAISTKQVGRGHFFNLMSWMVFVGLRTVAGLFANSLGTRLQSQAKQSSHQDLASGTCQFDRMLVSVASWAREVA